MAQYGFYFDGQRCTGCKACVMACKDYNDLGCDLAFRQVYEYGGGVWEQGEDGLWGNDVFAYYLSVACNHCAEPACVAACPQSSMVKDEATGFVYNDPETCIGCGACVAACPYGAPAIDAELAISVKCDGCHERVEAGLAPVCAGACPRRALEFGDIEELRAQYGDEAGIAPLPDPSLTKPSLVIRPSRNAKPFDDTTGALLNANELVR